MAYEQAWDAVVADLTEPVETPPRAAGRAGSGRPVASYFGRPFSAVAASIQKLKERTLGDRYLYMVSFDDQHGQQWRWLIGAEQDQTGGWVAVGGAGGSGDGPHRSEPQVNLAGWWGPGRFYVGGELLAGDTVDRVRLTTRDQLVLEDDTAAGVVLFLAARTVELPVTLELCDRRGQTLATQIELDFE